MLFICGCGEQRSGTLETSNSPEMRSFELPVIYREIQF